MPDLRPADSAPTPRPTAPGPAAADGARAGASPSPSPSASGSGSGTGSANGAIVVDAALVRGHQAALWRYLRVLGADADTATDVAQEAFVVLLRAQLADRGPAALRAWLRATARNLFLAACRRQRRSPVQLDAAALEAAWIVYEGDDDGAGYRAALDRCLETLPEPQRALLLQTLQPAGDDDHRDGSANPAPTTNPATTSTTTTTTTTTATATATATATPATSPTAPAAAAGARERPPDEAARSRVRRLKQALRDCVQRRLREEA